MTSRDDLLPGFWWPHFLLLEMVQKGMNSKNVLQRSSKDEFKQRRIRLRIFSDNCMLIGYFTKQHTISAVFINYPNAIVAFDICLITKKYS